MAKFDQIFEEERRALSIPEGDIRYDYKMVDTRGAVGICIERYGGSTPIASIRTMSDDPETVRREMRSLLFRYAHGIKNGYMPIREFVAESIYKNPAVARFAKKWLRFEVPVLPV